MSEPGQATDKANTDTLRVPVLATSQAEAAMRKALDQIGVELTWSDIATAVRAVAPILMQAGRDQAHAEMRDECTSTLMDLAINPDHHGCPCRTTGRHRVHRCMHGTEWWSAVPDSHNTQEDA